MELGGHVVMCHYERVSQGGQDVPNTEDMMATQGLPSDWFGLRTRRTRRGGRRMGCLTDDIVGGLRGGRTLNRPY